MVKMSVFAVISDPVDIYVPTQNLASCIIYNQFLLKLIHFMSCYVIVSNKRPTYYITY